MGLMAPAKANRSPQSQRGGASFVQPTLVYAPKRDGGITAEMSSCTDDDIRWPFRTFHAYPL